MIELIALADGRKELRQWDTKRQIKIDGEYTQIHFSNVTFGRSEDVKPINGVADIPDKFLQFDGKLYIYGYMGTYENGYTAYEQVFDIVKRPKPAGYVFTPTEQKTLAEIEKKIGDLDELNTIAKNNLVEAINEVAQSGGGEIGGENGATFYPHVDYDGNLSWTNDKGLPNPEPVNIKGDDYVLTDDDKSDIAKDAALEVIKEQNTRKTVYINQHGYCYDIETGEETPLKETININNNLKLVSNYKFVYIETSYVESVIGSVPFCVDLDASIGGAEDTLILSGEIQNTSWHISGVFPFEDEIVSFAFFERYANKNTAGEIIVGDFLEIANGRLSVNKTELLGDVEKALDELHTYAQNLVSGGAE